jgi:hypothetical protein
MQPNAIITALALVLIASQAAGADLATSSLASAEMKSVKVGDQVTTVWNQQTAIKATIIR